MTDTKTLPLFSRGDLDGFFGLFIDNLVQLLLIVVLCGLSGIGPDSELLLAYILPGAAVSLLLGNLFYAVQAHRLAKRTNRDDVTALPYGINTPSLLVYLFFVMVPVYKNTNDARLAWQMGLIACLGSGVIELLGAIVAEKIRQHTPRAALLATLAGIAIGFISMTFTLQIFQRPLVAMLPLAIILITFFSRVGFPLGLPGGFVAVLVGTGCAWLLPMVLPEVISGPAMDAERVTAAWASRGWYFPQFAGGAVWEVLQQPSQWLGFLSVIIPMGLFNVIGSLQNIESAEAAGDNFATAPSLAANGVGTVCAALFGSCFPTTIYIGHPGWKGLGAKAGYSTLNGLVIMAICLTGTVSAISAIVPMEAGVGILLWIGIIITAQSFQTTPTEHAPAVAVGLFPAIAAWGATVMMGSFGAIRQVTKTAVTMQEMISGNLKAEVNGFLIHGMVVMERGYIFTCMFLAAISVALIQRKFHVAAIWSCIAAVFTGLGLMHAYQLSGNFVDFLLAYQQPTDGAFVFRAQGVAIGYLLFAAIFAVFHYWQKSREDIDQLPAH